MSTGAARRAYRALLRLLPPDFRGDFGSELEAVHLDRLRDASGAAARAWIWLVVVWDVLGCAATEWTRTFRRPRTHDASSGAGIEPLLSDLRHAGRSLARRPGFAAVVVTTLALGIGAAVAVFSVVDTVLLRPLPYPGAERIVSVETFHIDRGESSQDVSGPDFLDWQARNDVFERMAVSYGVDDEATVVDGRGLFANPRYVSADFFAVFGQTPAAGRLLSDRDIPAGEPTVAIVAHHWAETYFGSAAGAVGNVIAVYGTPVEIVGVAARGFRYPGAADLWIPWLTTNGGTDRSLHNYQAVGRLRPDVDLESARARMRAIGDRLAQAHPENRLETVALVPLQERLTGDVRRMLWVLMGAVVLVLLIACANAANLLIGRGAGRSREIALHAALGAGRGRIVRYLVAESAVLAGVAGVAGLLLASALVRGLVALAPADLPRIEDVGMDATVVAFALGLTCVTALLFGLAPAIQASRLDLSRAISRSGSRESTSNGGARTRAALVVTEVALSVVLLAGAGLLLRSFHLLERVDLGFSTERVLVATTEYPVRDATEIRTRARVFAEVLDRVRDLPAVSAAAGVAYLGMGREPRTARDYFVEGRAEGRPGDRPQAEVHDVTEDYFETLQIPLLAGRDFARTDEPESPFVAIVNETLARVAFPGESPVGRRIRMGTSVAAPWLEIVGVVGDVRWQDPSRPAPPVIFRSSMQGFGNSPSILVRTSLDDEVVAGTLRALMDEADPTVPLRFEAMDELFADAIVHPRFRARLIATFAGAAVLLSAVGLFSVLAYSVGQRTREIGVRRAVGAGTADVVGLVVGQGMRLVAMGTVLGVGFAVASARLLETLLFEVGPWDVGTYVGGLLVILGVAFLATLLPVLRAVAIAPLVALRPE